MNRPQRLVIEAPNGFAHDTFDCGTRIRLIPLRIVKRLMSLALEEHRTGPLVRRPTDRAISCNGPCRHRTAV